MQQIVECVPNFSEGCDKQVIGQIVNAIESEGGVKVLNVDPGEAANRTVVTFVGEPVHIVEAAFRGVKAAGELIDMRRHHGTHPRIGATDVLPLVPVYGISLEQCALLARNLARRVYEELGIACYCYEAAALKPEHRNLAVCRAGEYESLPEKIADPARRPDFAPDTFTGKLAQSGASVIGARNYLIAVNFNLNTTSTRLANAVAFDVREKGRKARVGGSPDGELLKDENGEQIWIPGTLKGCKALGWYIEEYGIAQVSMNITDINVTSLHKAYEEVCRAAAVRGLKITGTEIIGLVPKCVLIDAGNYFLEKQHISTNLSETQIMEAAVKAMALDDLRPFNIREKVIECVMEEA